MIAFAAAMPGGTRNGYALAVLFAINALNFFDRQILPALGEPIRREWRLSDAQLGALGTAFTLLYAFAGVPLGRLADRASRTRILAAGVFAWSALTGLSGLARSFWQLFVLRLGVGVGEASCAPAATSLIGDLFPAERRARALSIFMMGLPVGIAASYAASSSIAQAWGWRSAFSLAALPGLACAAAVLLVPEPRRSRPAVADAPAVQPPSASPYRVVLSIPTLWWLIVSGAIHNFTLYAISSFLSPYLMRYHGTSLREAGLISMMVYGVGGGLGLLLGGTSADAAVRRRADGRMLVAAGAILASIPLLFLALGRTRGDTLGFALLAGASIVLMYVYYPAVYAGIQDVVGPSLRGTAMALYFMAMYVLGASLGPVATGLLSDRLTERAARAAGVAVMTPQALEPFRADGLHAAMQVLPVLGVLLMLVLLAAARTVTRDAARTVSRDRGRLDSSAPGMRRT
jgi:predicted MFS family arabinose efflux permease